MSDWNLLRVMLLKEIRTTFRERAQMLRMAMSFVVLSLVVGNSMYQMSRVTRRGRAVPPPALHNPPANAVVVRWATIAGAAAGGFFFSAGYLIAAILACFVGEKENRTLEVLLASPLSDAKLFLLKSASVLIPSAFLGSAFAMVGILVASAMMPQSRLPFAQLLLNGLVFGVPALIFLQMCIVGLGAAISVKAETMKGAGQTLGAVMMVLIFGSAYGLPMLLRSDPSLQQPLADALRNWLTMSFGLQYGMLLAALAIAAAAFLTVGRILFRRDRMLA